MAVSETARLVTSLELQDKFSGTATRAERSLSGLERASGRMNRGMGVLGGTLSTALGIGLERVVSGGLRLLTGAIVGGVESLNELESVTTATNTVIASTKGVAGQTAEGIRALSEEYESLNATIDDKVIQSAANLLLTFTNVGDKAFEPALEAALNLNEALGGGEAGLQGNLILVAKALNDPIRGLTTLRRVGVGFSEAQEDQIKLLVEQNDLYGAQQVILDELTTQFGGRFAAAGQTAEGRAAALTDRIEDLQKALAGPILPVIDRVREKLITLFESPAAVAAATKIGETIADLFTDQNLERGVGLLERGLTGLANFDFTQIGEGIGQTAGFFAGLPWDAIGSAFQLMGTGAKAALDLFTQAPPWLQTAVLTGWGLNRLTGGALGDIVGALGTGLIKGILGMNAGVVNINAAVVNGPGGGVPTPGGGKFPLIPFLSALTVPLILSGDDNPAANPAVARQQELLAALEAGLMTDEQFQVLWKLANEGVDFNMPKPLGTAHTPLGQFSPFNLGGTRAPIVLPDTAMRPLLDGLAAIETEIREQNESDEPGNFVPTVKLDSSRINDIRIATAATARTIDRVNDTLNLERAVMQAYYAADASRIQSLRDSHQSAATQLGIIANKDFSPRFTVQNNVVISATLLEQRLISAKIAAQGASATGAQFELT